MKEVSRGGKRCSAGVEDFKQALFKEKLKTPSQEGSWSSLALEYVMPAPTISLMFQQTWGGGARGWFGVLHSIEYIEMVSTVERHAPNRYAIRRACYKEPFVITRFPSVRNSKIWCPGRSIIDRMLNSRRKTYNEGEATLIYLHTSGLSGCWPFTFGVLARREAFVGIGSASCHGFPRLSSDGEAEEGALEPYRKHGLKAGDLEAWLCLLEAATSAALTSLGAKTIPPEPTLGASLGGGAG
ncbi:hypothetical protein Tco_0696543 [Tanacetum coccineum]